MEFVKSATVIRKKNLVFFVANHWHALPLRICLCFKRSNLSKPKERCEVALKKRKKLHWWNWTTFNRSKAQDNLTVKLDLWRPRWDSQRSPLLILQTSPGATCLASRGTITVRAAMSSNVDSVHGKKCCAVDPTAQAASWLARRRSTSILWVSPTLRQTKLQLGNSGKTATGP